MSKPTHHTFNPDLPNLNGQAWVLMGMATKAWAKKHNLVINDKPCGQYYRNSPGSKNCAWIELYLIGGNEVSIKLDSDLQPKEHTTTRKTKI